MVSGTIEDGKSQQYWIHQNQTLVSLCSKDSNPFMDNIHQVVGEGEGNVCAVIMHPHGEGPL